MDFKNFFCGSCKLSKPNAEKKKIFFYNPSSEEMNHGNCCMGCFNKLRGVFMVRFLSKTQTTLLNDFGIETKEESKVRDVK